MHTGLIEIERQLNDNDLALLVAAELADGVLLGTQVHERSTQGGSKAHRAIEIMIVATCVYLDIIQARKRRSLQTLDCTRSSMVAVSDCTGTAGASRAQARTGLAKEKEASGVEVEQRSDARASGVRQDERRLRSAHRSLDGRQGSIAHTVGSKLHRGGTRCT